uniref:Uncharacterized protein n=1 Tax=Octopus bimaculoides TaxID=37653 RepID=A0A0L8HZW3_OCTBM
MFPAIREPKCFVCDRRPQPGSIFLYPFPLYQTPNALNASSVLFLLNIFRFVYFYGNSTSCIIESTEFWLWMGFQVLLIDICKENAPVRHCVMYRLLINHFVLEVVSCIYIS